MGKFELSLSQDYMKDWSTSKAINELLQNAYDQESINPANVATIEYTEHNQILRVSNKESRLKKQTLLLGGGDKGTNDAVVGHHGEGYKVASLVLVRAGLKVQIENYLERELWTPRFVNSRRYGVPVLTFFTEKLSWNGKASNDLSIVVQGVTPQVWEKVKANTIQLQDIDENDYHITSKGDILRREEHKGKLFVGGLFVCTINHKYGYNVKPKHLELDRDRQAVSSFDLQWLTGAMWAECNETKELLKIAKEGIEDVLYLTSHVKYSSDIVDEASKDFYQEHGDAAIPVASEEERKSYKVTHPEGKPIIVKQVEKDLVERSDRYDVNMEELELDPDSLDPAEADRITIHKLLELIQKAGYDSDVDDATLIFKKYMHLKHDKQLNLEED